MQIILENELEKFAWGIMMEAHYKWEKNHGDSLSYQVEWYFEDLLKEETDKAINEEIERRERRLRDKFGEEFFVSEDEYVKSELEGDADYDLTDEERQELEQDYREDYRAVREDIDSEVEYLPVEVKDNLRNIYYTFFNAPETLTVIFNGEVIQGEEKTPGGAEG